MTRIRTLKPELWQDEAIGEISREARLTFIGLITQADDAGRLRGDPRLIGSQIFPYDVLPAKQVEAWLAELDRAGLIQRYAHAGRPLICLPAWGRNQKIDKPSSSVLPGPEEDGSRALADHSTNDRGTVADHSPQEGKGSGRDQEGIGKDQEGKGSTSAIEIADAPLSHLLADLIAENDPNGKRPTITQRWADAERLLIERDGRKRDEVERLIRWVVADDFESANVLSMTKLRSRYSGLWQKATRTRRSSAQKRADAVDERIKAGLEGRIG